MNKIALSVATAILTVTGLSSFKAVHSRQDLYYFYVNGAEISVGNIVIPNEATFFGTTSPSVSCPAALTHHYYCMIAVTINQMTAVDQTHLRGPVAGSQLQTIATTTSIS